MSNVSSQLNETIEKLGSFVYLFEISLESGQILRLTSSNQAIKMAETEFTPYSGISLKEGVFDDSAKNHIILEGIFEEYGITDRLDLKDAKVRILLYFNDTNLEVAKVYDWLLYRCTLYTKYDLSFTLYLEPQSIKYNQSLLKKFSKTCRANFGDAKCKIDIKLYQKTFEIINVLGHLVTFKDSREENGYFNNGQAILGDNLFQARILHHSLESSNVSVIELDKLIPEQFLQCKHIMLATSCDKKFITCCNRFNNALNFRGEPFIPEGDFLSITV